MEKNGRLQIERRPDFLDNWPGVSERETRREKSLIKTWSEYRKKSLSHKQQTVLDRREIHEIIYITWLGEWIGTHDHNKNKNEHS